MGYHNFSQFISSDNDFFVLRRFDTLHARVLLGLQDKLSQVDERLEAIETRHRQEDVSDVHNGSFRQEKLQERKNLLVKARGMLRTYSMY